MSFTPEQVVAALAARGVSTQCPRCSTAEAFDVLDGFTYADVRGGQNVRNAALQCRNCGYLSLHSLEVLGRPTS